MTMLIALVLACSSSGPAVPASDVVVVEPTPVVEPASEPLLEVVERPITWDAQREELTVAYLREHYGRDAVDSSIIPRLVVLHWTAGATADGAFNTFNRVTLPGSRSELGTTDQVNVSAQYLVDRDGTVFRLMPETTMARHTIGLNASAIGIENVGDGDKYPLTDAQLAANIAIVRDAASRHDITHVIGHHQYTWMEGHDYFEEKDAAYRTTKVDPGDSFVADVLKAVADLGISGVDKP